MRLGFLVLLLIALTALPVTDLRADDEPADAEALADLRRRIARLEKELEALRAEAAALEARLARARSGALWTVELSSDSKGSGHVADLDGDGKPEIVFGTYFGDAHLYCVNAEDGSVSWTHPSEGGPFDASVAVADLDGDGKLDVLAADSASGRLYCLGPDGQTQWTMKLPSGTDSPPAVGDLDGDGKPEVVVGTMWRRGGAGAVCAIDPRKRTFLWQASVAGCVQSEPALVDLDGDGTLDAIVTSWRGDRGIHALNGKDGTTLWTRTTDGDEKSMGMYHGVCVVGEGATLRILTPTCQGDVYALDAKGEVLWKRHFDDYLFAPSAVADFDGDGALEIVVGGRMLRLLRVEDGEVVWERPLPGGSVARGAVPVDLEGDGKVEIVLSSGTQGLVLRGASGATVRTFAAALDEADRLERISSAPLIADFDGDGALDFFVVCGRGYSGGVEGRNRGRAYAFPLGKGEGTWTTFRGNLRRTGTRAEP